ncbi:family 16 glycosylhydrolase [Streptomyces sp. NPDC090994]|uniref:glycoside hydrolase family 16 protein n=1 Tax=Streptomyces sp. NPDC090994 TaxID=3365969 RepID=UPI003827B524
MRTTPRHARPKPRSLRIGILVTAGAVTTTALSLATAASGDPSAPRVTQLGLGPGYLTAGQRASARLEISADRCVTADRVTVAVRDDAGRNLDFPGAESGVRLCPSGHTFTSGAREFPAGSYTMFGSWQDTDGVWHPLPSITLKVGATRKTEPEPEPTPEPAREPRGGGPSWEPSGAWKLRFSDEFEGDSLDTSKWNTGWFGTGVTGPVNSAEDACYDARNVGVSGGALHLELTGEDASCKGKARRHTGAHVNTMGKFSYSYGAVEYRARVPSTDGEVANWPALWDTGEFWPRDGETDTMEGLSGEVCSYWHATDTDRGHCPSGDLTGWHTFGHRWEPGKITWFYDGKPVHTQTSGVVGSPHYLVMQNTQGSFGGPTLVPADLQVDWVRVWTE